MEANQSSPHPRLPRRLAAAALAALLAAGAAGCDNPVTSADDEASPESDPSPVAATDAPAEDGEAAEDTDVSAGEIAVREVDDGDHRLTLTVTELRRQGQALLLTWTIETDDDTYSWDPRNTMGGGGVLDRTVSGVTLVDLVNGKRYLVARTTDDQCVCSGTSIRVQPDEVEEFNAAFRAPPPDVTHINIDFKDLGVIADVPLP